MERRRCTSCSLLISRLKMATERWCLMAVLCVILNVAAGWHQINEGGDVAGSSYIFQLVPSLKFITDRDEISGFALLIELDDDLVDGAMCIAIEIVREQKFCHLDNCLRIDNDAAEHSALCFNVLR